MARQRRGPASGPATARQAQGASALLWAVLAGGALLTGGMLLTLPARGQTVPEVVRPRADTPTLPPNAGSDRGMTVPRSENPLPPTGTARPIPDGGVIAPPSGSGTTPVIRPPATDGMAVIPPPGAPGGDRGVVPK